MRILLMEKNLILLSRIRSSLSGHEVRAGGEYQGEDIVLINLEQFSPEVIKGLKEKGAKVIAYCGHKRLDLINLAKELGADLVVPNSQIINTADLILKV